MAVDLGGRTRSHGRTEGGLEKRTCKFVEQEENREKAHADPGQESKWEMSIKMKNIKANQTPVTSRRHFLAQTAGLAATVAAAGAPAAIAAEGEVDEAVARLRSMSYSERASNACIGHERADLVLAGCAILEAIREHFPAERLRIADRGLREGILSQMMREDSVGPHHRPRWR